MPATQPNNDAWLAQQLAQMKRSLAALTAKVGVNGGVYTRTGSDAITISGAWQFLAHTERVDGVYVPPNSIVYVTYHARFDKTAGSNGIYTILTCAPTGTMTSNSWLPGPFSGGAGGNNAYPEVSEATLGDAPTISGVICTSGYMYGANQSGSGLTLYGTSGNGDPVDTWLTAPQALAAPLALVMPTGTYDFGVAWDMDAGVAASRSNPFLCVDVRTFVTSS